MLVLSCGAIPQEQSRRDSRFDLRGRQTPMTAGSAHDKAARGATDVMNAANDIENVAASLGIVD